MREFIDATKDYPKTIRLKKTTDGFLDPQNKYRADFIKYLKDNLIGTMIMTGANGDACVKESINQSLANDCSIVAYAKGIVDFNFTEYLYPYPYYEKVKADICEHCRFEVTSDRNVVIDAMRDPRSWPQVLQKYAPSEVVY